MKPSSLAVAVMTVVVLLLLPKASETAITCSDVIKDLKPCLKYLANGNGSPPSDCCAGASKLSSVASTSADKKAACMCIKSAAQKINPNAAAAKALPGNCGISLPFDVSPSVDCSKVG